MKMRINGVLHDIEMPHRERGSNCWFYVLGHNVNGQRCRISSHCVPWFLFDVGGEIEASGNLYEFRRMGNM